MKTKIYFIFCLTALVFHSCGQKTTFTDPVVEPGSILKNVMSFLTYREKYLSLKKDFISLDANSNIITKKAFLRALSTGNYLPLLMASHEPTSYYKLYMMNASVPEEVRTTIKYWGLQEYDYYNMEGKELPDYHFMDMDGQTYTKQNTRGKILVLKCWFLHCLPCIEEIPILNELKAQYKDRNDILFVSLCWDARKDVEKFLRKTKFDYSTVSDQYKYLTEKLQLNAYPTHFVINKQGQIAIKTTENKEMAFILKKESLK